MKGGKFPLAGGLPAGGGREGRALLAGVGTGATGGRTGVGVWIGAPMTVEWICVSGCDTRYEVGGVLNWEKGKRTY